MSIQVLGLRSLFRFKSGGVRPCGAWGCRAAESVLALCAAHGQARGQRRIRARDAWLWRAGGRAPELQICKTGSRLCCGDPQPGRARRVAAPVTGRTRKHSAGIHSKSL
eukprot:8479083-Pyramimonas_sp.AAC.1